MKTDLRFYTWNESLQEILGAEAEYTAVCTKRSRLVTKWIL